MATAAITAAYPAPGRQRHPGVERGVRGRRSRGTDRHGLDPDFSLVERCLSGDETAWEELVRLHTRRVYGLCYRFTGRDAEAQDLTQDVFLRVFRTLKSYRSAEGSFVTWLARVSRNLLIDHYRRTRQERVTDSIEEQLPMLEETDGGAAARAGPGCWRAARPARFCRARWQKLVARFARSGDPARFAGNGVS